MPYYGHSQYKTLMWVLSLELQLLAIASIVMVAKSHFILMITSLLYWTDFSLLEAVNSLGYLVNFQHLMESWARLMQSLSPHPISETFVLILYSNLRLCTSIGLFLSGFYTELLSSFLFSPMHTTCSARLILDFILICSYKICTQELFITSRACV
jgi:hypothetical protein